MKLLLIGEWKWYHYEQAFSESLDHSGINVIKFSTLKYFNLALSKIEYKFPIFPFFSIALNINILFYIKKNNISHVFFWRPIHILPFLLKTLKNKNIKLYSYNNDDPFNSLKSNFKTRIYHKYLWFWYKKGLKYYDINFFYRSINIRESYKYFSSNSKLLLPYFIPWHIPLTIMKSIYKKYDVVFIGHYEDDGRLEIINHLLDNNIDIRIWGGQKWNEVLKHKNYKGISPIHEIHGIEYYKLLANSKICISFLSKLNRDEYTRRSFEIPASASLMLSERTKYLENIYIENREIIFFDNKKDLVEKIKFLLANPSLIDEISHNSSVKVNILGGDINFRAKYFIEQLHEFNNEN